jgi:aminoglycoside phosphotransferase (APT) family kinase protein
MHTHQLTTAGSTLTKRFTSWSRGEHRREWAVLSHVNAYQPDLVPVPVAADLDADPPWVTMTVVPGSPLGDEITAPQLDALANAIRTLWRVPLDGVETIAPWRSPLPFARRLTDAGRPIGGIEAAAYDAAVAWWRGPDPALLDAPVGRCVIGHGDPNMANYLWDGRRIRIVDFEDAGVSDPAAELAVLVEHLSARNVDAEAFRARLDVEPERFRAARRAWAMFWLALLLPGGPAERRNPPGTAARQATRLLRLVEGDPMATRSKGYGTT